MSAISTAGQMLGADSHATAPTLLGIRELRSILLLSAFSSGFENRELQKQGQGKYLISEIHPCGNLVSDFGSRMKGNVVSELLKLLMHRFERKLGFDDLCLAFWEQRETTIKSIDRSSISVSQRSKPTQEGCPHRVLQILCREW
jgi:hypothetical protein